MSNKNTDRGRYKLTAESATTHASELKILQKELIKFNQFLLISLTTYYIT